MNIQDYIATAKKKEEQGLWDEAIMEYEKALVLDQQHKDSLLSLSRLYLFRNKPIQSLEILHSHDNLRQDPDFMLQLSSTYMALNRFEDAERILLEALHQHTTAPLLNNLGVVSIRLNKRNEAINYLSNSLELDKKNVNTWFNLATYYESQGDLDKTIMLLKKAIQEQEHPDLMERYALALARKKMFTEAMETIDHALQLFKNHPRLLRSKLKTLFVAGLYEECMEYIHWLENEAVLDIELRKELLEIKEQLYFNQKQFENCHKTLDILIQQSNQNPVYYLRKAFVFQYQKNFESALEWLSKLLKTPNLQPQLRSEGILMMKAIEMENWKHFSHTLLHDPTFKDALMQNPVYAIQSRGIMLPKEGVAQVIEWLKNPGSLRYASYNDGSTIIN
jgi:tetratricopeptide (TPR) repeat protein